MVRIIKIIIYSDGHGAVGQEVSGFLKENLPSDLNTAIKASKKDIVLEIMKYLIYMVRKEWE